MTRIIILAAGKGTRMNSDLPKVLMPLKNRPMIKYLLDSIQATNIDPRPILIVSPINKEMIAEQIKEYSLDYAIQEQQLGTGHAVASIQGLLGDDIDNILVLYGDHPFFKSESIKKIADLSPESLVMMTTKLTDFNDWRHNFNHWGRIIRNESGEIAKIVEFKDASEEERSVTEVNPAVMCFNRKWLLENLSRLNNNNKSGEYYLTDLVKIAFNEGLPVTSISVEPHEAMGVNSLEELKVAEELLVDKNV